MGKHHSFINTVDQVISDAANKGIMHLSTENMALTNNTLRVRGKDLVNFGSCSYLGLEFDQRLINGSQQAVSNYGTQFSASRAYISTCFYDELEELFCKIFKAHALVMPTTTLGHMGVVPIVVEDGDAVILDHQVHNSVQTAAKLVKARGVHVELVRHSRMDKLEERIKCLRQKHRKIWYMADGVYSMYGDTVPVNDVYALMDKYPELHFYVDDAHGMSVFGEHGAGYVLSQQPIRDRMVFTTSLAKAFATGGAVVAFNDPEIARKIRTCAASLVTSGPIQPAVLGAAIESSKIHLSNEIYELQDDLHENIKYTNLLLKKYGLPNVAEATSPVFFVGVSLPKLGYNMIHRMMEEGYYLNHGIFPGVPIKNTGIRFTITRLHTFDEIDSMISTMATHFPKAVEEEGFSMGKIYKAFKMTPPVEEKLIREVQSVVGKSQLKIQQEKTIDNIDEGTWNTVLGDRGSFDKNGMSLLEKSFTGNAEKENNWTFDYLVIKDLHDEPVLATFFTTAQCKDDMLSPEAISIQIEEKRQNDPYFLTSKTLFAGSLLTEGNHLYINKKSPLWKEAMQLFFDKMGELQEKYEVSNTVIRDLPDGDSEMDGIFTDNGYFKTYMPENHQIDDFSWSSKDEYLEKLSAKSRRHVRGEIIKHFNKYDVYYPESVSEKRIDNWYNLYLNVKNKSMALNTFTLPKKVFENIANDSNWDVITLQVKPENNKGNNHSDVAVMFCHKTRNSYSPMIIGIDYEYQKGYNVYRQMLYQGVLRANALKMKKMNFGFAATIEKKKLGAKVFTPVAYMQTKDNYNMEVIGSMSVLQKAKITAKA
jgi:7-keto-8-aminopelargonate synthetase-like enzyme/predicted N-acyltransferase